MRASDVITLYVVDDQAMVRAALCALLRQDGFEVIGHCGDSRAAVEQVGRLRPDVVVLDISMPGLSGIDALRPLKRASPHSKVLMASQHEGGHFVRQALVAGADGYLSKESDPAELRLAVQSVLAGRSYVSPRVAAPVVTGFVAGGGAGPVESPIDLLTAREREVLQMLALGNSNKQVAAKLGVSLGTIKKHRENLQRKLDCHTAAELTRLAIREGLLSA